MHRPARHLFLPCLAVVALTGCASAGHLEPSINLPAPVPVLRFGVDTLAFRNESRSKNAGKPDLYANYCFVMARAITQFHHYARFAPEAPRVTSEEYTELVREVTSRAPWHDPLPLGERVVIPGFASLYELSAAEEHAVKAGLPGRFWGWVHWTNWRVTFPVTGAGQERVVMETMAEIQAGRPVQLLVTNFPVIELNHTVIVYDYRVYEGRFLELRVYDPNDPSKPGSIAFDRVTRRFFASEVFDTHPGDIRAFRMYYTPLL
jgi:hypothetical protein